MAAPVYRRRRIVPSRRKNLGALDDFKVTKSVLGRFPAAWQRFLSKRKVFRQGSPRTVLCSGRSSGRNNLHGAFRLCVAGPGVQNAARRNFRRQGAREPVTFFRRRAESSPRRCKYALGPHYGFRVFQTGCFFEAAPELSCSVLSLIIQTNLTEVLYLQKMKTNRTNQKIHNEKEGFPVSGPCSKNPKRIYRDNDPFNPSRCSEWNFDNIQKRITFSLNTGEFLVKIYKKHSAYPANNLEKYILEDLNTAADKARNRVLGRIPSSA